VGNRAKLERLRTGRRFAIRSDAKAIPERTVLVGRIGNQALFPDPYNRLLDDILRFRVVQSGFPRGFVNQFPIRVEKNPPAFLVIRVFQPAQE